MTIGPDDEGYGAPFRVRFDEAAPDGRLRTSGLLRYAQDLAWIHSEALGFDRAWYGEHALTWLVRAANVAVLGAIPVGAELTGTTRVVGVPAGLVAPAFRLPRRGRRARRDRRHRLGAGRRPRRPDAHPADLRDASSGSRAGTLVLGRVALGDPPADAHRHGFTVRPQELDPMVHVNNAVYADWLDEAVIAAGDPAATGAHPAGDATGVRARRGTGRDPRGTGVVGRRRLVVPPGRRPGRGHAPGAARAAACRAGGRPGRPLGPDGADRDAELAAAPQATVITRSGRSRNGGRAAARFENGRTSGWSSIPRASAMNRRRASMRAHASG